MSSTEYLDYDLPRERIAQRPLSSVGKRSDSKLLYARKKASQLVIEDLDFEEINSLLKKGDLLVLNDCKVQPVRFFARKDESDAKIEIFLISPVDASENRWEALARPMRKLSEGDRLQLSANLRALVIGRSEDERRLILELQVVPETGLEISVLIEREGCMPIPPYIRDGVSDESDKECYQTVFASQGRAIAAPTAGLHFTDEILNRLRDKAIRIETLTLEVGLPSIRAIQEEEMRQGRLHAESYVVPKRTKLAIDEVRETGGRVVAVGTTVVRALESFFAANADAVDTGSESELFIQPGFEFKVVDAMLTNFHQPMSTHLMLVAAFIGEVETSDIYKHALSGEYRFLSYGDAMLLER